MIKNSEQGALCEPIMKECISAVNITWKVQETICKVKILLKKKKKKTCLEGEESQALWQLLLFFYFIR